MDAVEFLETVREICELHESCAGCPLNGDEVTCNITDRGLNCEATIAKAERWRKEHVNEDNPGESSDIYKAVTILSDKILNLEKTVQAMKNVIGHHGDMLNNIEVTVPRKGLAKSMNEPKSKRTRVDMLLVVFPDASEFGLAHVCPRVFDTRFKCDEKKKCEDCRRVFWCEEVEE